MLYASTKKPGTDGRTILLCVIVRDTRLMFLIDSGSTHSFINKLQDVHAIRPMKVTMAGGSSLIIDLVISNCQWSCDSHLFNNDFRFLDLGMYDGILGLDWLATHGQMQVDWKQKWVAFLHMGEMINTAGSSS